MNQRRRYDQSFKKNAVLLTHEPGRSVAEVAEKTFYIDGDESMRNLKEKKFFLAMEL